MSEWRAKRFWEKAETHPDGEGFRILLDGRPVSTPARSLLVVPSHGLAKEIAAEWDAQVDDINPLMMPLTRTANAAIDKVVPKHGEVADMLAQYGDSDLLCYRAESPAELVSRQAIAWDALLDWADETLGARLVPHQGVIHQPQGKAVMTNLTARVHQFTNFELAAFHDLVSLSGSLIIGFAAVHQFKTVEMLWQDSRIDENWQIEQWGEDEEAKVMEESKCASFLTAYRFYRLLGE